jgi:hypothetical protein
MLKDLAGHRRRVLGREHGRLEAAQPAVQPHPGRRTDLAVQVRSAQLRQRPQVGVDIAHDLPSDDGGGSLSMVGPARDRMGGLSPSDRTEESLMSRRARKRRARKTSSANHGRRPNS